MIFRSVFAFHTQSCIVASLFLAGLLSALSVDNALAGSITFDNTVFTGNSTDLTAVGNQSLPYTDSFSRVISAASGEVYDIYAGYGLYANSGSVEFSNLPSP